MVNIGKVYQINKVQWNDNLVTDFKVSVWFLLNSYQTKNSKSLPSLPSVSIKPILLSLCLCRTPESAWRRVLTQEAHFWRNQNLPHSFGNHICFQTKPHPGLGFTRQSSLYVNQSFVIMHLHTNHRPLKRSTGTYWWKKHDFGPKIWVCYQWKQNGFALNQIGVGLEKGTIFLPLRKFQT